MTATQFIANIATKASFVKWATVPVAVESVGGIEKWQGIALVKTGDVTAPDGTNLLNVFFLVDTATGEATWQNLDQLDPLKNISNDRIDRLEKYLKANFFAYFLIQTNADSFWAKAEVFTISGTDLAKSTVLVYKPAGSAITHKTIL